MSGFSDLGSRAVDGKIGWSRDGKELRIPGLKSETWGTQSFWDGQMWATRLLRAGMQSALLPQNSTILHRHCALPCLKIQTWGTLSSFTEVDMGTRLQAIVPTPSVSRLATEKVLVSQRHRYDG